MTVLRLLFVLSVCLFCSCSFFNTDICPPSRKPFAYETRSPQGRYFLRLKEKFDRRCDFLIGATVTENEMPFVIQPKFAERECDDGRAFDSDYHHFGWVTENVFRVGMEPASSNGPKESVTIKNETSRAMRGIVVSGHYETFFILELESDSSIRIEPEMTYDAGEIPIFVRQGQFVGGQKNSEIEIYRRFKKEEGTGGNFCVKIKDADITIERKPVCDF
jgi:hypothetical protein